VKALRYTVLIVLTALFISPLLFVVLTSFKNAQQAVQTPPKWIPDPFTSQAYERILTASDTPVVRWFLNSMIAATLNAALVVLTSAFAAYALARLEFRGKSLALSAIIAVSMFPGIALVVPLLKIFTDINWINTYQALILPSMSFALPLSVWNLTAFFRQMPQELEQAAMVDGCTPWQAFRKIIIPLAAPGVFTTAIIAFVAAWNEFIIALTMTNKSDYFTAVVAISQFQGKTGRDIPVGSQMAAGVILTVPLIIMVLAFQRRIVSGLTAGGVK
jgi:multiple sugar transport system permease protein